VLNCKNFEVSGREARNVSPISRQQMLCAFSDGTGDDQRIDRVFRPHARSPEPSSRVSCRPFIDADDPKRCRVGVEDSVDWRIGCFSTQRFR
jgi:hypothetical protein